MTSPILVEVYDEAQHAQLLDSVKQLYEESFPIEEQRPWHRFLELLGEEPRFTLSLIFSVEDHAFAGFLTTWNLGEINYGEHFAIEPSLRGRGWGRMLLRELLQLRETKPFVFEVEPPVTPIAERRLHFYQSLDAAIISTEYIQPSYAPSQPSLPLYLMAWNGQGKDADKYLRILYKEIYRVSDEWLNA